MNRCPQSLPRYLLPVLALMLIGLAGCKDDAPEPAAAPINTIHPRVVSFSPALTDMLFKLGLDDHLVGVTTYCSLPAGRECPVVGNQLNIRAEPILAVEPEMILTQTEPAKFQSVSHLCPQLQVQHFQIETLDDIAAALARIGRLLGKPQVGLDAQRDFQQTLQRVRNDTAGLPRRSVVFVMGHTHPSLTGSGTFMDEMITLAGGRNVAADTYRGWKQVSLETLITWAPEVIICQSSGNQTDEARTYWEQLGPNDGWRKRVYVVTDADWTIPAAHLAQRTAELAAMIHPELDKK